MQWALNSCSHLPAPKQPASPAQHQQPWAPQRGQSLRRDLGTGRGPWRSSAPCPGEDQRWAQPLTG